MDAYSIGKTVGVLTGFVVGLVIVVIIAVICNKNRKVKTQYDERQQIIRGKGYHYAFYAIMIFAALNVVLSLAGLELPVVPEVLAFCYIFVGAATNIVYCIFQDAYWGLNNNKKRYLIVFLLIALLNIAIVVRSYLAGTLIEDGRLGTMGTNLLVAVLFLVTGLAILIQMIREKKALGSEEETAEV